MEEIYTPFGHADYQTIVANVVGQAGKRFLLVRTQYSSETEGAQIAFDITGPWR